MIHVSDNIWVGDSSVSWRSLMKSGIRAVLNVAHDLRGVVGWPDVEYAQVGLIDGPGNPLSMYCAAALTLAAMADRCSTLVFCHTGSRSVAVAMMCMNIGVGRDWDGLVWLVRERVDGDLPVPHTAHLEAFGVMDWMLLEKLLNKKGVV